VHLKKNASGASGFFNGNSISFTDVGIYYILWSFATENKESVDKVFAANPKIAAISKQVESNPKVAAYLAARKQTPM